MNDREIKKLKKFMFMISLLPLFIILIILKVNCNKLMSLDNLIVLFSLIMLIIGLAGIVYFKNKMNDNKSHITKVMKVKNANYENLSFLATYIIPLICFPLDKVRELIAFVILLIIVGEIFVRTNMYYSNPSLILLNYHIYEIEGNNLSESILIIRGTIQKNDTVAYISLGDNIIYGRVVND